MKSVRYEKCHNVIKQIFIPPDWWEPIATWINLTKWSFFGLCDDPDGTPKHHMRATWLELLLVFQIQSGFRFRDQLDLASAERAFKTTFRKIVNVAVTKHKGKVISVKQAWNMAPSINSLKHVIGHTRPGICRRPIVNDSVWHKVIKICTEAMKKGNCSMTFGVGFRVDLPYDKFVKWTPGIVTEAYDKIFKKK